MGVGWGGWGGVSGGGIAKSILRRILLPFGVTDSRISTKAESSVYVEH